MVKEKRIQEEQRKKEAEEERKKAEAEKKKIEKERAKAEAEKKKAEAEKQKAEEERKKAEAEKKKAEEERKKAEAEKKKAEAEKQRIEAERKQEALALRQKDGRLLQQMSNALQKHIRRNFNLTGLKEGSTCKLEVRMAPGGVVLSVAVTTSSGDELFDRRAVTAVQKSSPLPVPEDVATFQRLQLNVVSFIFNPWK